MLSPTFNYRHNGRGTAAAAGNPFGGTDTARAARSPSPGSHTEPGPSPAVRRPAPRRPEAQALCSAVRAALGWRRSKASAPPRPATRLSRFLLSVGFTLTTFRQPLCKYLRRFQKEASDCGVSINFLTINGFWQLPKRLKKTPEIHTYIHAHTNT